MADSGFSSHTPVDCSSPVLSYQSPMDPLEPTLTGPIYPPGFVDTTDSNEVEKLMENKQVKGIIISGRSGIGKTYLATQMCAKLWNGDIKGEDKIYRFFSCERLGTLYSDLQLFYGDLNTKQHALDKPSSEHTWSIIQTLCEDMKKLYPRHHKIFIFDDAEHLEELLKILNSICAELGYTEKYWKFLVTAQKCFSSAEQRRYSFIGHDKFVKLEGFNMKEMVKLFKHSEIDETTIQRIVDVLGPLPLALTICMKSLGADEMESNRAEYVDKFLSDIGMVEKSGHGEFEQNPAPIAIMIGIKRLCSELSFQEGKELIMIMSFLNEKNISVELLLACAETVAPNPEEAKVLVRQLTSRLVERSICLRRTEHGIRLFTLHKLVRKAMRLFVKEDQKLEIIRKALIALTRVIPKDGRQHKTRLLGFYAEHGESLHREINKLEPLYINHRKTPFIVFLHCNLLVGLGYCLVCQPSSFDNGLNKLELARDRYCELVFGSGSNYKRLIAREIVEEAEKDREVAKKLYDAAQRLPMLELPEYKDYVRDMAQYHRLTKKDLKNMAEDFTVKDLINDHLIKDKLQVFKQMGSETPGDVRVIDADKLAKVAIVELLAEIFCVWSKMFRKNRGSETASVDVQCIHQAEAAVEVYNQIYTDFKVYLLAAVITERDMLSIKVNLATEAASVEAVSEQLEDLSRVGQVEGKRLAFEAGLMRSDMSKDHYHELLCLESTIACQGRLFDLSGGVDCTDFYIRGMELLVKVEELAGKQIFMHSALSYSYRNFAKFLSHCKKYGEAAIFMIKAMRQLHLYIVEANNGSSNGSSNGSGNGSSATSSNGSGNGSGSPEFDQPRFSKLYKDLLPYYHSFITTRRDEVKMMRSDMEEAKYLKTGVAAWKQCSSENQPSDAISKFEVLETIVENEIEKPALAAVATASEDDY